MKKGEGITMTKLETLTVPVDLGEWLQSREIGDSGTYFSTIDSLFHYWDFAPDTTVFNFISQNKKELIEVILGSRGYRVDKPLYYALIKGHELIAGENAFKYWKCDMRNGDIFLSNRYSQYGRYLAEMTENDWGKFGINESNADFVKVDEELN